MAPRPYRLGRRQAGADDTRARIIAAARDLLMTGNGLAGFTVDAVARAADVARQTVYYQFGSKVGLLEALCDSLALAGGIERLPSAFRQPDPLDALDRFVAVLVDFHASDRVLTRRLRGMATLDQDLALVLGGRDERRRKGLRVLVGRLGLAAHDDVVDLLHTLTSFETFDALAGAAREPAEVARLVQRLVRVAAGVTR